VTRFSAPPLSRKRVYPRLLPSRRPDKGVAEWLAAMVRGLDALDFLERSRDLAAEPVAAAPVRIKSEVLPLPAPVRVRL
jgi:hypothetical protein